MRSRRLLAVLAALVFTLTAAPITSAGHGSWPSDSRCIDTAYGAGNYHAFVQKHSSQVTGASYFDKVNGTTTLRTLHTCVETPVTNSDFNAILPANIQTDSGTIYQLGYWDQYGDVPHFIYAHGTPTAIQINSPLPVVGRNYKFEIYRRASGKVSYTIWDLTATPDTAVWSYYPTTSWSTALDKTWWGYEIENGMTPHGQVPGGPSTKMWDMQYSTDNIATDVWRSDLTCYDIDDTMPWESDHDNSCSGMTTRLGQVSTSQYNNDTINITTIDHGY